MIDQSYLLYLNCTDCIDECPPGTDIRDFSRLSVAVSPLGDLLVGCNRHFVVVASGANKDVPALLLEIADQQCCGTHHKETAH